MGTSTLRTACARSTHVNHTTSDRVGRHQSGVGTTRAIPSCTTASPYTPSVVHLAPLSGRRPPAPLGATPKQGVLHEHVLEAVEALEAPTGAEDDRLQREVDELRADRRLLLDAQVESPQHRAAADEVD